MVETTRKPFNKEINENIPINEQVEIGLGCSYGGNGDSYPLTIVRVSTNGKTIWVTEDDHHIAEGYDYYTNQVYTYETNWDKTNAECYTLRKNGRYVKKGCPMGSTWLTLSVGHRAYRQNPHF